MWYSLFYSFEQTLILIDQFQLAWFVLIFKTAATENAYTFLNNIVLFSLKSYNLNLVPERGILKKRKKKDTW